MKHLGKCLKVKLMMVCSRLPGTTGISNTGNSLRAGQRSPFSYRHRLWSADTNSCYCTDLLDGVKQGPNLLQIW